MGAMEQLQKGASYPAVNDGEVSSQNILIPPLSEQKRIVEILDEKLGTIEELKKTTSQQIVDAKELFESRLSEVFGNKNWIEKKFEEVCVLQRGFDLPTRLRHQGSYPLVSSNGVTDHISQFKVKGPGVITGRSGSIGNVHYVSKDYWPLNTAYTLKILKETQNDLFIIF